MERKVDGKREVKKEGISGTLRRELVPTVPRNETMAKKECRWGERVP